MNRAPSEQSLVLPSLPLERTRANPPGQPHLVYGGGAFLQTLDRLLIRLQRQAVPSPDGSTGRVPFARFNEEAYDDWTLALLHAWASVTDVLGFYHERIVNEGYLRTAAERLSLVQLARTVGYELQPGLAASALLAITVVQGSSVFVPKGTAVQSIPPPKSGLHLGTPAASLPQIFETSEDFVARPEWNLLRPAARGVSTWENLVLPDTTSMRLLGNRTDLKKGDRLLIVGHDPDDQQRALWRMAQVASTTPAAASGFTVVAWEPVPGMPPEPLPVVFPSTSPAAEALLSGAPAPIASPQLFVMRQKAKLFAYTSTGVVRTWAEAEGDDAGPTAGTLPGDTRLSSGVAQPSNPSKGAPQWWPAGAGLPHEPITLTLATRSGQLISATAKDLYRSIDGGASWQRAGAGLHGRQVTALSAADDGALVAGTDKGEVFLSPDEGETWRQAASDPIYLPARGLRKLVPAILRSSGHLPVVVVSALAAYSDGSTDVLAAGTDSGVFLSTNRGRTWKAANLVLPKLDRKTGLANVSVEALATAPDGRRRRLYAGTEAGVFPIRPTPRAAPVLIAAFVLALLASRFPGVGDTATQKAAKAFAGLAVMPKQVAAAVNDLAQHPLSRLLLDTAALAAVIGAVIIAWWLIWRFLNNRPSRRIAGTPPPASAAGSTQDAPPGAQDLAKQRKVKGAPVAVRDLQSSPTGLLAGTSQGVFHAAGPGPQPRDRWLRRVGARFTNLVFPGLLSSWTQVGTSSSEQPDVQTLTLPDPETLLAAAKTAEIYRYRSAGGTWQPGDRLGDKLALTGIAGAVASSGAVFLGGTPPQAKAESQWSPWQVQRQAVHLDSTAAGVDAGGWLILETTSGATDDQRTPLPRLVRIVGAERSDSLDAVKKGSLLSITVDRRDGLVQFDRTVTQALFQSELLEIYSDESVQGSLLALNSFVPGLQPGQPVAVSGKRKRARLVAPPGKTATLTTLDGLQTATVHAGESLILLGPPLRPAVTGPRATGGAGTASPTPSQSTEEPSTETWRLLNRDGIVGYVQITRAAHQAFPRFVIEPPQDQDPEVSEFAVIRSIAEGGHQTTVTVTTDLSGQDDRPLANIFERGTVGVRANIVRATHGSTVPAEVLGSSDGAQANQRFVLRQAPLTVVSSASPEGFQSTLSITVAGVAWHQVPFLDGHPRDERAYVVQQDEQGRALVTFGDGRAGARLPSTREEVRATYRIGIGEAGNVAAGSLTQLRSAPPGLAGVTNPLPASGGVDPEADHSIRANAPLRLRALHRIISLSDYEDFVRAFPGIGRVQAKFFRTGQGGLLHLTVADGDGNPLDSTSALTLSLRDAVERARAAPTPKIQIDSYEAVFFDLAVTLFIAQGFQARGPIIAQQARQALADAFNFQRRRFAQDVSLAEIVALLQPSTGVLGVKVKQLAYHGDQVTGTSTQASPDPLQARPARWHQGTVRPAQMLLINRTSSSGIVVDVEAAR